MALTKANVRDIVDVYIRAWVEQDADLIETIFMDTAVYHERVFRSTDSRSTGNSGILEG